MTTEQERPPLSSEVKRLEGEVGPHAHHPLLHLPLFEQLQQRNVFRVAVLYKNVRAACLHRRSLARSERISDSPNAVVLELNFARGFFSFNAHLPKPTGGQQFNNNHAYVGVTEIRHPVDVCLGMGVEPFLQRFVGRCILWCLPRRLLARWSSHKSDTDHVVRVYVIQRDRMRRQVHIEHSQAIVGVDNVMQWFILNRYGRRWLSSHDYGCDDGVKHGRTLAGGGYRAYSGIMPVPADSLPPYRK